jgi:hypothetical protein
MRRRVWMIFLFMLSAASVAADDAEVAALRDRVAALEAQNTAMRAELDALKARLGPAPPPPAAAPAAPPAPPLARAGDSSLAFYGFVRVDAIYDDSRPSAFQTPLFILSEDSSTGLRNKENLTLHPRLTRFGMNYNGPRVARLSNADISGRIEIDFQNGGRESRAISRFRHAYLQLARDRSTFLLGQTSDVISPLFPNANADTLMWNAGNLGDRRPQVRYRYKSGPVTFESAAGLTGAVDDLDLDADGVRDGEASALPNLQARVGFDSREKDRWSVGLWGMRGWQETSRGFGGERTFVSSGIGADYRLALGKRARLQGEAWSGTGLSDFRGGIGQSINTGTGDTISSRGGWLEFGVDPTSWSTLYLGYTVDDPDDSDVPANGRTKNDAWYVTNRFRFGVPFQIGIEYLRWKTRYRGLALGLDNRFDLYAIYNF